MFFWLVSSLFFIAVQNSFASERASEIPLVPPHLDTVESDLDTSSSADSDAFRQGSKISLQADKLIRNTQQNIYEATGNVRIIQDGLEVRAEELVLEATTQDVDARGNVQLKDLNATAKGDQLQYNLATTRGLIREGKVLVVDGNFRLAGDEIEKYGQADYFIKNGSFTTCDGVIPDWKFSAREVNATLGGYARAKHVVFYIKDVPVLYVPYMFFPVKTERESGFLSPWLGYSNTKGALASLAWYQVIDRHLDATFYLDTLAEIGIGKGFEYRYSLARQNNGKALYYHVTGLEEEPNYDYFTWDHHGNLPGNWSLAAEIEYASDQQFFDEFGSTAEEFNRDKTVSTVIVQRNWEKLNFVGYSRYIKDLERNNDLTLQRLPELGLGLARRQIGNTPIFLGLESYATRFWRDEGEDGERLFLRPFVSASFKPGNWIELTPEIAVNQRLYNADSEDDNDFLPEFSLTLATRLMKDYHPNFWGVERLLHSVEPKVIYTYIPEENQDNLPLFDLFDRIPQRNEITYALVNRLTSYSLRNDGNRISREVLNMRLAQRYNIDEARNNTSGNNQPFSDVQLELDFNPTEKISMDIKSLIPVYGDTRFRRLSLSASAKGNSGNKVNLNYTYRDNLTDYLQFKIDTSLLKPVYLSFEERYDFRENRELEKIVGLEYRAKCWSLFLTYRERFQDDGEDDREVMFNFVLAGLGKNQGFGSGFIALE